MRYTRVVITRGRSKMVLNFIAMEWFLPFIAAFTIVISVAISTTAVFCCLSRARNRRRRAASASQRRQSRRKSYDYPACKVEIVYQRASVVSEHPHAPRYNRSHGSEPDIDEEYSITSRKSSFRTSQGSISRGQSGMLRGSWQALRTSSASKLSDQLQRSLSEHCKNTSIVGLAANALNRTMTVKSANMSSRKSLNALELNRVESRGQHLGARDPDRKWSISTLDLPERRKSSTPSLDPERRTSLEPPEWRRKSSSSTVSSWSVSPAGSARPSFSGRESVQLDELDLSMYGQAVEGEFRGLASLKSRGRICFSSVLDIDNEVMVVNILRTFGLVSLKSAGRGSDASRTSSNIVKTNSNNMDRRDSEQSANGSSSSQSKRKSNTNFVVRVSLTPDNTKWQSTKSKRMQEDSEINESFCFTINKRNWNRGAVRLRVQEVDRLTRRQEIGGVNVPLQDIYDNVGPGNVIELWRDILVIDKPIERCARLLLSLRYNFRERLLRVGLLQTIWHSSPQNNASLENQERAYIQVGLINGAKTVCRKQTLSCKLATSIAFMDYFNFTVSYALLDHVTLAMTLYTRDSIGQNTVVGRTNVGSFMYASGTGLEHWNDMLVSPNVSVEMWHDLK